MTSHRTALLESLWQGRDPFAEFEMDEALVDGQGWSSRHPYLLRAIDERKPAVVIEIGVWKGGSTITMARRMKALKLDAVVISVDTWLGSVEHWANPLWFDSLRMKGGYPTLQRTFMANVVKEGVQEHVIPLPLDSLNASILLKRKKVRADVIHIDAAHDYASVAADLAAWWPLLKKGGVLIGDDYRTDGGWLGVRQAFDEFAAAQGLSLQHQPHKCWIDK